MQSETGHRLADGPDLKISPAPDSGEAEQGATTMLSGIGVKRGGCNRRCYDSGEERHFVKIPLRAIPIVFVVVPLVMEGAGDPTKHVDPSMFSHSQLDLWSANNNNTVAYMPWSNNNSRIPFC